MSSQPFDDLLQIFKSMWSIYVKGWVIGELFSGTFFQMGSCNFQFIIWLELCAIHIFFHFFHFGFEFQLGSVFFGVLIRRMFVCLFFIWHTYAYKYKENILSKYRMFKICLLYYRQLIVGCINKRIVCNQALEQIAHYVQSLCHYHS